MSKKQKKIIIWSVVILLLIIFSVAYFVLSKKNNSEYTTALAQEQSVIQTVSVTGKLVAEEEINLDFENTGRISDVPVKEGDEITAGEEVARMNDKILSSELNRAKAALDKEVARVGMDNDSLESAKKDEENAQKYYEDTKDLNKKKIDSAEEEIENAQKYYDAAQDYYKESVHENGENSLTTKSAKLSLTTAKNNLENAKKAKEVEEQQANLYETSAKKSLDSAKSDRIELESDSTVASQNASIESAKSEYDIAEENLTKANLIAPVNGTISVLNYKVGEVYTMGSLDPFATMISHDLIIESNVPESDIVKIKNGMKTDVTFDAIPNDEKFQAEVIEISPASTTIQDVVSYKVKFKLETPDLRLKPGMTANIDVQTSKKDNVIAIPIRAVKTEGEMKFVEVLQPDKTARKVQIQTGLEGDEGIVEVKSGLNEGDNVITMTKN